MQFDMQKIISYHLRKVNIVNVKEINQIELN